MKHFVIIMKNNVWMESLYAYVCVCMHVFLPLVLSQRSISRFVYLAIRPFVDASMLAMSRNFCVHQFKPFQSKTNKKFLCNLQTCPFFTFELRSPNIVIVFIVFYFSCLCASLCSVHFY